jgi:hypothetical protein
MNSQHTLVIACLVLMGTTMAPIAWANHGGDHGGGGHMTAGGHEHGSAACATEHGSLSGQIDSALFSQKFKNPVFAGGSGVIDMRAIEQPAVSPVNLMFLNGRIVPKTPQ